MVGSLGVCGRVAAVALLAVSSAVPHGGLVASAAAPTPVADVVSSCSVTVGTATTDPARASDAARALTVGYAVTDCMPDATLIAAAEARAAIALPAAATDSGSIVGGAVADSGSIVGGAVAGTSSGPEGGSATAVTQGTATTPQGTATAASVPSAVPTTSAPATTSAPSTTTAAETTAASSTETTTSSSSGTSDTESGTKTTTGSSSGTSDSESSTETTTASSSPTSDGQSSTETTTGSSSPTSDPDGGTGGTSGDGSGNGSDGDSGDSTTGGTTADGTAADGTTTAAGRYGWGQATRSEDFDGDLSAWGVYDGPGHAGKGRRSPTAMSVADGVFTITGDSAGTTGGMAWRGGAKYGRWEARVRSPAADPTYNPVMLLWPDAENFPVGGEIDFMEITDETRQKTGFFLHYGESNRQLHGQVAIDATQWHNWAVEWAPDHITAYVDGQEWYTTRDTNAFPPGPMHLTLQLDWFPKGGGAVRPSTMSTDWVRYYPIEGSGASGAILNSADAGAGTFVGPQVAGGAGTGATVDSGTGGGSGEGTDANDDSDSSAGDGSADDGSSVAGVTATSTTTVTRPASATAAARASGTTGTATASSGATTATVSTTAAHATVTAGSADDSSDDG